MNDQIKNEKIDDRKFKLVLETGNGEYIPIFLTANRYAVKGFQECSANFLNKNNGEEITTYQQQFCVFVGLLRTEHPNITLEEMEKLYELATNEDNFGPIAFPQFLLKLFEKSTKGKRQEELDFLLID